MFGKVPPSNTPGPPPAASCVTSITKSSSCGRQTAASASTCLPCFSVEETPIVGVEEKPKPWRPKDTAGPVVSEAPCNTLQSIELPTAIVVGNVRRNDPAKCNTGNGISGSGAANSKYYSPKDSLSISSSSSASSSSSSSSSSSTSSSSSLSSQSGRCQSGVNANTRTGGQISTSSTHNRCSSNYGCSFGKPSNGLLPPAAFSRSQRIVGTAVHVDACTDLRETSKHHRKHLNNANSTSTTSTTATVATSNRESASERDQQQPAPNCVLSSKDVQSRYAGSASVPQANSKANPVRRISCDAVGSSAAVGVAKSRVVVAEANCDQPSLDPASLASSASVDLDGSLLGAQVHPQVTSELARVAQKSPVALMTSRSPIARNDISSNDVDTTTTTTTTTTTGTTLLPNSFVDRSATCKNDFVTSTPSKEHRGKDSSDTNQQNCVSCLPQDLPTELQSSSPRSYKDRERCRDPWRPTEMEGGNQCALNPCPSDVFQDGATKRRTGASCQALRHAVASLNRLDDFYMEKIGAGFFSEVFKVTHKVTAQVMVLKMNQLPANRPNMLKEVQLMNKLSHPNILRFMGVCVHEGQLHALTEYINGGSLEQLIMSRHAPLPHLIRMNLAKDVARGMAYLHSRGLFHRDLTSKNVLIKKDETYGDLTAVVGDFGLAAKIPDPSSGYRLSTVGSPYWMSPECLKGQWYDHRSDVFSFGIVVCELIGRVPADPDVLPRSDNFGLDYLAVAEICAAADPPPAFLQLAFDCCTYEPKSRPTFPEIVSSLESMINNYEEESKTSIGNRQSADPALMSSMDEIVREGRTIRRKTARLRSQSADARGCDNATPSDKARCHSARRVAELASKRDPHYRPMTANPFHALGGVKKILGNLFSSCLELPSLEDVRPSVTDVTTKFKPAQNDTIVKILERKKPSSEPSSPTARKKWERKVATKVGAASLFAHPLFRDGWEPRRRGSCESGFWSCVGEDLSPEPPNRRHTSTLSSSAASSLFLLDDHRTSSIYTDSSEDIASLGGGDSSCWEDRLSGIGSSSKTISKIVEYFERKQAASGSLRLGDHDAGPSRMTLLRASLEGPVPLCSISAAQRLVVCEGAVRSKLPLFDKK